MILQLLHERSHPIPTIPSILQRGITHTWMGETMMVYGEALVMTMAMIPFDSPSRRSAGTGTSGPRIEFRGGGGARMCFLEKVLGCPSFLGLREFISERGTRGGGRVDLLMCWRGQEPAAPAPDEGGSTPPSVWSSGSVGFRAK